MGLDRAFTVDDLRELARRRLPKIVFDYLDGGTDGELCLRRNRTAFEEVTLVPRYLADVSAVRPGAGLFGKAYAAPFGIGPTGSAGLVFPDGDRLLARAAGALGVPFVLSAVANASIEEAAAENATTLWSQVLVTKDRGIVHDMVRRAADCGVGTLVVTIDIPGPSNKIRSRRNGLSFPLRLTPRLALDGLTHPRWLAGYLRGGGMPTFGNWIPYAPRGRNPHELSQFIGQQIPSADQSWADIERIRSLWPGKLVIKGILHPQDAKVAAAAGADGILLSNHGGRQHDRAPATLSVLPHVREAVADDVIILVDSGIRRGSDIVSALALGADFTLVGRATLYGLAASGMEGARRALDILLEELRRTMIQTGCVDCQAIASGLVWRG